jgi:ubiquitin C-terminal hydrolase
MEAAWDDARRGGGGGGGGSTLADCLNLFSAQEQLDGDNAWFCPKCKEHREAFKQVTLWTLPNVLVVHLKRFRQSGGGRRSKIEGVIDFPVEGLDLAPFLAGECVCECV